MEWIADGAGDAPPRLVRHLIALRHLPFPRLVRERWVRLHLSLQDLPPLPAQVTLTRIDETIIKRLAAHPERDEPQCRSAQHFWRAGFGDGYLWLDDGVPLCMMWLITARHDQARRALGVWRGIYRPLPPENGIAEGLYTFRRGLRRHGGAATPMMAALMHAACAAGLQELHTHIHSDNLAARRWAARVGWQPYGTIERLSLDLPGWRGRYLYLHQRGAPPAA